MIRSFFSVPLLATGLSLWLIVPAIGHEAPSASPESWPGEKTVLENIARKGGYGFKSVEPYQRPEGYTAPDQVEPALFINPERPDIDELSIRAILDHPWQKELGIAVVEKYSEASGHPTPGGLAIAHFRKDDRSVTFFQDLETGTGTFGRLPDKIRLLPLDAPEYVLSFSFSDGNQGYFFDFVEPLLFQGGGYSFAALHTTGLSMHGLAEIPQAPAASRFLACLFDRPEMIIHGGPDSDSVMEDPAFDDFEYNSDDYWVQAAGLDDRLWQDCAARTEDWSELSVSAIKGTSDVQRAENRDFLLRIDFLGICEGKKVDFSYLYELQPGNFVPAGCTGHCDGFDHEGCQYVVCGGL